MLFAVIFLGILSYDLWRAFWWPDPAGGGERLGAGLGTLLLAVNLASLTSYTVGCHSMRHILGGFRNQFSRHPAFRVPYACSTCLNATHGRWAWVSLFTVAGTDLYIRLCSMGILSDPRLF